MGEGQRRNGKQILDERGWSVTRSDGIVAAAAAAPEFQQLQKCVTGVCVNARVHSIFRGEGMTQRQDL